MTYTWIILFLLGLLGILMHNLMKMDDLNKKQEGKLSVRSYIWIERFSILLSICVVICAVLIESELKQLEQVNKIFGLAYIAFGYMSQSILIKLMGRADKILGGNG